MPLSEEYIAKYTELFQKHFDIVLSRDEAYDQASKLLHLVNSTYRPMTEHDFNATRNRLAAKPRVK